MFNLSLYETRVLGVLFEKERTTPDQYPLSLNALTNACNQKSNREPVLNLEESIVQETVDELIKKGLVTEVVMGGRTRKFRQRFGNTEFSDFKLTLKEQSVLSVLFLRGAQTPGELRTRTNRLCDFADVHEVEKTLQELMDRSGDAYVVRLPRDPGKRESRYAHLFSGEVESAAPQTGIEQRAGTTSSNSNYEERIADLENKVEELQSSLQQLQQAWNELNT